MKGNAMKLKQIGMRAGTLKSNRTLHIVNFIDKHPITLNMTFKRFFPFALKRVVTAFRRQGLFVDNHIQNFDKFTNIPPSPFHQPVLSSVGFCVNRFKHRLIVQIVRVVRIIPIKVFKHFLKSMKPAQCGRYLAPQHGSAFLNDGDSLGVGHIVVRGANRAYAVRVQPVLVQPLIDIRRRSFRDRIGGPSVRRPLVRRLLVSVRNTHEENIA